MDSSKINVLVIRPQEHLAETVNAFSDAGLSTYCFPYTETVAEAAACFNYYKYDYCILTSPIAVKHFASHLKQIRIGQFIAVGDATAKCISELTNIDHEYIITPDEQNAAGIEKIIRKLDLEGKKTIAPGPLVRAKDFTALFAEKNAYYESVCLYKTVALKYCDKIRDFFNTHHINVIAFFSPSSVKAFLADTEIPAGTKSVAIGKSTADALSRFGITSFMPRKPNIQEMAKLIQTLSND